MIFSQERFSHLRRSRRGTVGDIESLPFLRGHQAVFKRNWEDKILYLSILHVGPIYMKASDENKDQTNPALS